MTEPRGPEKAATDGPPLVYSVVLNHENFADSDECIESLIAQRFPQHRVVLVDNGSHDSSFVRLKEKWSHAVEYAGLEANLGVAAGYNAGIRVALAAGADCVVVCNNDIAVAPDFIEALLAALATDDGIGMAVPLTVYYDDPDRVWFAGIRLDPLFGFTRNLLRGHSLSREKGKIEAVRDSDYVLTHATMIRRSALERAGPLDERFFYGYDDVDYSLRLRRLGFRCVAIGGTVVRHKVSATAGTRGSAILNASTAYTYGSGTLLVGAKHLSGIRAPMFVLGLAFRAAYTLGLVASARRWDTAAGYLKGLANGFRLYGAALITGSEARLPAGRF